MLFNDQVDFSKLSQSWQGVGDRKVKKLIGDWGDRPLQEINKGISLDFATMITRLLSFSVQFYKVLLVKSVKP